MSSSSQHTLIYILCSYMYGLFIFLCVMFQMIASKYLNDEGESEALTNSEWADVGCKSKATLDSMERKFLADMIK